MTTISKLAFTAVDEDGLTTTMMASPFEYLEDDYSLTTVMANSFQYLEATKKLTTRHEHEKKPLGAKMETLGQMGADSERTNGNAALESTYTCKINIDFPESEKEQRIILANIEDLVNNFVNSVSDLEFVRAKVLDENATEISLMEFEHLANMDLRDLPWSKIKFEAVKLTRGSTFLIFKIGFEKAPRNIEDVNVYRLMELFIKSAIENIQFIKSVDPKNDVNKEEGSLMFRLQADRITFEELEVVLNHVRGAIKHVLGAAGDLDHGSTNRATNRPARGEVLSPINLPT